MTPNVSVRAMVMAAGAGTRLKPLTNHRPKPMIPIANRPVLEYTLLNLKRHGIRDIILNLHAFPEQIKNYFGDGSRWGLRLSYSHETELLGTAGGVKNAESFLNQGTFMVMSGDGLTDANLTDLLAFHRRKKSFATMAMTSVESRFDYGVTLTTPAGRIQRFVEKPSWGDVFSDQVNSGIYVFEPAIFSYIRKNRFYDFGKQVWPQLLKQRKAIYGWKTAAYWCDVGNLSEYRRAQMEFLEHKLSFRTALPERKPGVWAPKSLSLKGIHFEAPCLIGEDTTISAGATIGRGTVIGSGCTIESGVRLYESTVWDNVHIHKNNRLDHCIVMDGVRLSAKACAIDGAIILKNDTLSSISR